MCEVRKTVQSRDRSPMSSHRSVRRLLLLTPIVVAVLALAITAAMASAAGTWGELARIGPGSGKTAIKASSEAAAFGVDPTTNTIFVGDEPTGHEGKYRIQELNSTGVSVGSAAIVPQKEFTAAGIKGGPEGIEGVAVDPVNKVIYVLAVYERAETTPAQENKGEESPDEDEPAAGALYAFSTEPNGAKELVPATGANAEGVLATPATLKAQGEQFGEALLEPAGIAVDPKTGDVIILGEVDEPGETLHTALQRVSKTGEAGARYVDPTETGEEEAGGTTDSEPSNSPIVTGSGHVLVQQFNKIVQIPTSFAPVNPTLVYQLPEGQEQLQVDANRSAAFFGGGLSAAPASETSGTLFASALIKLSGDTFHGGALELEYHDSGEKTTAAEVGWTGGSSSALGPKCALSVEGPKPEVAAAQGGKLLIFDPQVNQAVEFGPGGSGCPVASAGPLAATVGGTPVNEVAAGTNVKLSAPVTQANALTVEWDFGEGEPVTKLAGLGQAVETTHTFAKNEQLQVKATIRTDDLASEPIIVTKSLKVAPAAPTASFSAPTVATVGQLIELNASSSSDPNKVGSKAVPITKYAWKFGDGGEEVLSNPVAHHSYAAPNTYSVTLTVTDELGKSASKTLSIPVSLPNSTPPAPPPTTSGNTGGGSPVVTSKPTGTGAGGVLPFRAALAATSFTASAAGAVVMKVACVLKSSCVGTLTLKTLSAVSASTKSKKAILTLASGSFSAAGGQVKPVTLHLSAKAKKLLAHVHTLKVRATIVARDAQNVSHTTQTTVTLHAAKPKHH
jgi:PKD repeat protein